MLDVTRGEMVIINDRFTKKNCKFLRRIVGISQDSDIVYQISSKLMDTNLESKSKENSDKISQTHAMHEVHNIETMEHKITSKNDEDSDDHPESEQIMVPSDPSKWNSSHINEWISWCSRTFAIKPGPITAILPSTGKELLRLTLQDWQDIGGTGGNVLARHLAHLRLQATGVYTPDLRSSTLCHL